MWKTLARARAEQHYLGVERQKLGEGGLVEVIKGGDSPLNDSAFRHQKDGALMLVAINLYIARAVGRDRIQ